MQLGMASALETLCGQAYGAKQYSMLGVYLQRSWIVLFSTTILLLPLYIFTTPILEAFGQDKKIAQVAGTISLWSIGAAFSMCVSFTCQTFLQAQSKNVIIAYLAAFSVSIHLFLSWLLTVKYQFGLSGALTSLLLGVWLPNIGQLIFIMKKCPDTWKGFSILAFKDLWPVVKLSVSSGVMLCLEVWYSTILILLTGNMKDAEVALNSLSICLNISGWELMIALGFFAAAGVRVANELGRGSSRDAKFSIKISVLTSFAIGCIFFFVFLFLKERLAYIFTTNPDVADAVGDLSSLLAFSMLLNSVQPVLSGVSVGAGWQRIVAYVNIGCYYLIGIPVGVVIGVVLNFHVKGIWIGMLFGTFVQTIVLIIITLKTDWNKQVEIAQQRVNRWATVDNQESNDSGTSLLANQE
ncbi:putative multi antimicrobial extrusion protein [Medicago truncatula]|uniref:Putative multi antimicrobial extrusion protein n=1 Tax=Medicago truncatula TaxID=3880 RepID=A0A396HDK2_MEDTR|nr:putative multi antimicrobial extrusion protein [Medicago truncatula]